MYFKDYSIDKFLYELKTDLPSPGGGSTAALVSALAGALNSMVYSFTVDKKSFENLNHENKEKMKGKRHICKHTGMSLSASNLFIICKKYQLG